MIPVGSARVIIAVGQLPTTLAMSVRAAETFAGASEIVLPTNRRWVHAGLGDCAPR